MDFLRKCPDVAITLSDTYRYIMVDEYQDTNALQDKILHKLCCTHQNLAVVGDDSQSLYGFRRSSPESILHFPDKYPGCKVVKLLNNYRNSQKILDVANHVLLHGTERIYKELSGTHSSAELPYLIRTDGQLEEASFILGHLPEDVEEACVLCRYGNSSYMLEAALQRQGIPFRKFGGPKLRNYAVFMWLSQGQKNTFTFFARSML